MSTITIYKDKINGVGSLLDNIIKSSNNFDTQLGTLKNTLQGVNSSNCNLQDTIDSISSSSKSEKEKVEDLKKLNRKLTDFITTTARRDSSARDQINKKKNDFYTKYSYLKPECEKSTFEKLVDSVKKVCAWCKEHWKLLATIAIVVVAVALLCTGVGSGAGATLLGKLIAGACWGAIMGACIGGVSGGLESMANGGSFLDGFEDGAFSGAVSGAISGAAFAGIGAFGAHLGKGIQCASKLGRFIKGTAAVTKVLDTGMDAFDMVALADKAFGSGKIAEVNSALHENKAYNYFQTGVSVTSALTGGMTETMSCFVAGTLVHTLSGVIAIENLKRGDKVISANPDTMEIDSKTVLETFSRKVDRLIHLTVNGEEIVTTFDHPFYVKNKGFVEATNLWIGADLINSKGDMLKIENIYHEYLNGETRVVYNLNVQDFHTFFVGLCNILVHNLKCGKTDTAFSQEDFDSTKDARVSRTPSENNENVKFVGDRGNSKCVPKDSNSKLAKTLDNYGIDGIEYKEGVIDLSPTSHAEVEIEGMKGGNNGRASNFSKANKEVARQLNQSPEDAKILGITPKNGKSFTASDIEAYRRKNGLTWHELNDKKTMQMVPSIVNKMFNHLGGVGEINAQ